MSSKQWLAVAVWVFMPLAATAQQKQSDANPADPAAPATAVAYESAFKTFRSPGDDNQTPDKVWRSANEDMRRLGGHVGHMKGEVPQPVPSSDAGKAAPKQGGATDHSKHH